MEDDSATDRNASANAHETFRLGNYVVCIIDLLAQQENLKAWERLPQDGQLSATFRMGLKKTIGAISGLYDSFKTFFDAQRTGLTSFGQAAVNLMNESDRQMYIRQKTFELGVTQFSDTFVFYAPLGNSAGELLVLPVYAILGACCMAMQISLAGKVPLRGAVHIGPGIKLPELSFYGPALAEAHRLEARVAQYPRIVVSDEIVAFVQHKPTATGSTLVDNWQHEMLAASRNFLCQDSFDKQIIVDWLGAGYRKLLAPAAESPTLRALQEANDFVGHTATHFQQRALTTFNPTDLELAKRYYVLYQYLLNRLPDWGIELTDFDSELLGDGDGI